MKRILRQKKKVDNDTFCSKILRRNIACSWRASASVRCSDSIVPCFASSTALWSLSRRDNCSEKLRQYTGKTGTQETNRNDNIAKGVKKCTRIQSSRYRVTTNYGIVCTSDSRKELWAWWAAIEMRT